MRTRHRIPSIFNLSMVDVLCCALGCVILLWLLNLREAKQKAVQAVRAQGEVTRLSDEGATLARQLEEARARLVELGTRYEEQTKQAESLRGDVGQARRRVTELTAQAAAAGRERDEARTRGAALAKDLDAARAAAAAAEEQVAARKKEEATLRESLTAAAARVAALESDLKDKAELQKKLAAAGTDRADLQKKLTAAGTDLAALRQKHDEETGLRARAERDLAAASDRLAVLTAAARDAEAVKKDLAGARARADALAGQVKDREGRLNHLARQAADLGGKLKDAEARLGEKAKEGGTQAAQLAALRDELKTVRQTLVREEALARALQKEVGQRTRELEAARGEGARQTTELDQARRLLDAARDEKKRWQGEADRFRQAADNRFAGLSLTGRRVLFLVDMSGSMELVDAQTRASGKWESVRQTVARIMRSLPDLEKFQVILFSEKTSYPLGGAGGWLDYAPDSADRLLQALARVKPNGDTDMYQAFDEAFRFRPQGLDTIYLFSDGLPNTGQGLTAEQARTLRETEQSEVLGRHVRQKLKAEWNRESPGRPRVRINAVGFFYESPDVGAFLWSLTRENSGAFVGMSEP